MVNLYREAIEELDRRKIAHVREFAPFYISSLATHVFNIVNQSKHIYVEAGIPVNTRQHILFVTVPGFGKSFLLRQFLDAPEYSLVKGTDVECGFESSMTEAGLVGSIRPSTQPGGDPVKTMGLMSTDANAIIGIEEFSAITNAAVQEHNAGLDAALLTGLDSGMVRKRLANGKLEYQTNLTMWAGVQPARYNLSSGLGRRFLFLNFTPTGSDVKEFKARRRAAKNVRVDVKVLNEFKKMLNIRFKEIRNNVTGIRYTQDFYVKMDKLNVIHYEEPIYERIALGYWLMRAEALRGTIYISMEPELGRILDLEHVHRKKVKKGTQTEQVYALIKDQPRWIEKDLLEYLLEFSLDWDTSRNIVQNLIAYGNIHREGRDIVLGKK